MHLSLLLRKRLPTDRAKNENLSHAPSWPQTCRQAAELARPARLQLGHLAGRQVPEALLQLGCQVRARKAVRIRLLPGRSQLLGLPRAVQRSAVSRRCRRGVSAALKQEGKLAGELGWRHACYLRLDVERATSAHGAGRTLSMRSALMSSSFEVEGVCTRLLLPLSLLAPPLPALLPGGASASAAACELLPRGEQVSRHTGAGKGNTPWHKRQH